MEIEDFSHALTIHLAVLTCGKHEVIYISWLGMELEQTMEF